jgi:hypothetical protein
LSEKMGLINICGQLRARGGSECSTYAALAARVFNRTAATTMLEDLQIMLSVGVRVVRESW